MEKRQVPEEKGNKTVESDSGLQSTLRRPGVSPLARRTRGACRFEVTPIQNRVAASTSHGIRSEFSSRGSHGGRRATAAQAHEGGPARRIATTGPARHTATTRPACCTASTTPHHHHHAAAVSGQPKRRRRRRRVNTHGEDGARETCVCLPLTSNLYLCSAQTTRCTNTLTH